MNRLSRLATVIILVVTMAGCTTTSAPKVSDLTRILLPTPPAPWALDNTTQNGGNCGVGDCTGSVIVTNYTCTCAASQAALASLITVYALPNFVPVAKPIGGTDTAEFHIVRQPIPGGAAWLSLWVQPPTATNPAYQLRVVVSAQRGAL